MHSIGNWCQQLMPLSQVGTSAQLPVCYIETLTRHFNAEDTIGLFLFLFNQGLLCLIYTPYVPHIFNRRQMRTASKDVIRKDVNFKTKVQPSGLMSPSYISTSPALWTHSVHFINGGSLCGLRCICSFLYSLYYGQSCAQGEECRLRQAAVRTTQTYVLLWIHGMRSCLCTRQYTFRP